MKKKPLVPKKSFNFNKLYSPSFVIPFGIFLITLVIYIHNLSASVYAGDSGDFLSAILVKGVAHPSGYPLYTLLGILFNSLPFSQTAAWKVGLLSAILSSLSVVIIYLISHEFVKNRTIASISALTIAFIFPFWLFAEIVEVFALHHFFLLLIFFLSVLIYKRGKTVYLYLLALSLGLSFSNHELTVLILPSTAILVLPSIRKLSINFKTILKCTGLFLVGLIPYVYIPIAASHNPTVNWDDATNVTNFFRLVLRKDYGWNLSNHTNFSIRLLSIQQYLLYVFDKLQVVLIGLCFFGIVRLFIKKNYIILLSISLAFLLFGPISFLYNANVTLDNFKYGIYEKFYTSSMIFFILFIPFGLEYVLDLLKRARSLYSMDPKRGNLYFKSVLIFAFLIPAYFLFINFYKTDLHNIWIGDLLGKDVLMSLPKNSILTSADDDNIIFNSRYIQLSQNARRDVSILTTKDYSAYVNTNDFLIDRAKEVQNYEHKPLVNKPNLSRPIFITIKNYNDLNDKGKSILIPYGLLFKVGDKNDKNLEENEYRKGQQSHLNSFTANNRVPAATSLSQLKLIADIPLLYARAYSNTGFYLINRYHNYIAAKMDFEKALAIDSTNDSAHEGLGDYFYSVKECKKAKEEYSKAININLINIAAYQKLYVTLNDCLHDKNAAKNLENFFSQYPSLFKDIKIKN